MAGPGLGTRRFRAQAARLSSPEQPTSRAPVTNLLRDAGRFIAGTWVRGGTRTRVALVLAVVIAAALLGAFFFGLWHILFGGVLRGNRGAGRFGIALAVIAGALLVVEVTIGRRLLR